jgi:ATP-binding cassette subfamily B protein
VARVPVLRQRTRTDCGLTCLAMVLAYHGRFRRQSELEPLLPGGRDGQSALALLDAARLEGLDGRGLKPSIAALRTLAPAAILHWDRRHFVVLEGVVARRSGAARYTIVDPARGRRRLSAEEMAQHFSGVALELSPAAGFARRPKPRSALVRYVAALATQRAALSGAIALSVILTALSLVLPWFTAQVVDHVIPRVEAASLGRFAGLMAAFASSYALCMGARSLVLVRIRERFDRTLTLELLERLACLPYGFFQQRSVGDLVMRVTSTSRIREAVTNGAVSGLVDGLLVVSYLGLLGALSVRLAMAALAIALAQLALFAWHRPRSKALSDAYVSAEGDARGYQTRMLFAIETLKATGSEAAALAHFTPVHEQLMESARAQGRFAALADASQAALRVAAPLALLLLGAHEVLAGRLTLGTMLGGAQLCLAFLTPLSALLVTASGLQVALSHAERLEDVHEALPEPCGGLSPELAGGIELRGVSFRYGPSCNEVLQDVSLSITPGQRVAIVGPSGSGKSTLARVLLGLLTPQRGSVCFDGIALADLELTRVRRQIGVVNQDARLLDLSVADNLRLGAPEASQAELEQAARLAHIHDDIVALPMGYDTRLGDGGSSLSGGQRQRLALARALVRRPRVLLLDEATSALDGVTESAIQRALDALSCTTVTIAHRLSTVRQADIVLVLEAGRIVEQGPPEALLAAGGLYYALSAAQLPRSA